MRGSALSFVSVGESVLSSIALTILIFAAVAVVGLVLGSLRLRGIGLGSAGVLFAGIVFGHFGATVDHEVAHFTKEFGLVLFVFTIGLQLGPGIIRLWKQHGFVLNGMAIAVVVLGAALVFALDRLVGLAKFSGPGLFSGATTNTPSLGAGQQAVASLRPDATEAFTTLASAYAVAYPGGIAGIIASMLILKRVFGIQIGKESELAEASMSNGHEPLERRCVEIDNDRISNLGFGEISGVDESGIRISRIRRAGESDVHVATDQTQLFNGDLIQIVGTAQAMDRFAPLIGRPSEVDLMRQRGDAQQQRIVVTEPAVLNKTLRELSLDKLYNTTVTRIRRSGVEIAARGSSRLQYGDVAQVVGDQEGLKRVTTLLGNSVKALNETQFAPLFLGIAVGVLVGMIPIAIPGLPFPVKLGLAGGPLIAAIAFSLLGQLGGLIWYIPHSANLALREMGIILFLASAGISAGETFFSIVFTINGVKWMLTGIVVTMVPLLIVGCVARKFLHLNYLTICGVIAGSMTDPPALAFASSQSDSEACTTAYAAVYPVTMVLRIVAAQVLVYLLI